MDAKTFYLMEPTVLQVGDPLMKLDGKTFQKIMIDKVQGVNGKEYEVILIAANEEGLSFYVHVCSHVINDVSLLYGII